MIDALRAPIAADRDQSSFGVRTSEPPESWEKWLPRPRGLHPRFVLSTQQDLASHARVREGRMPRTDGTVTSRSPEVEAVVTEETAARLNIKTGALIRIPGELRGPLGIRITGIVTPENPRGAYWSTHDVLRTPSLVRVPSRVPDPPTYWLAGLLLPPDAAPALLDIPGQPERYWNIAPRTGSLDGGQLSELQAAVTATVDGGGLLEVRRATDVNTAARTELDDVLIAHQKLSRRHHPADHGRRDRHGHRRAGGAADVRRTRGGPCGTPSSPCCGRGALRCARSADGCSRKRPSWPCPPGHWDSWRRCSSWGRDAHGSRRVPRVR